MTEPGNLLACPHCLSPKLGENVQGWREIDSVCMVNGHAIVSRRSAFSEVHDAENVSFFCSGPKCNPDEELWERDLVQIDRDGNAIAEQPETQGRLA